MRILRGQADSLDADRQVLREMHDYTGRQGESTVRVWTPPQHLAFGRRDTTEPGYDEARRIARQAGYQPVERTVGGRAVAYTGTTIAFARCVHVENSRQGLDERYDAMASDVLDALAELDVDASLGEPADSFCPGAHSLQTAGKVVGIAQRVRSDAALVSGLAIVSDHERIAEILAPIYDALEIPFEPASVGSITQSGGPADADVVAGAFENALVRDESVTVVDVMSSWLGEA